jgi:ribosomal small subunit protein bTHX
MGKGDRKTARGKRILGTYGNSRKRKKSSPTIVAEAKPKKKAAAKKAAPKKKATKASAEKSTEKKTTAAKKTTAKKTTTKKTAAKTKTKDDTK